VALNATLTFALMTGAGGLPTLGLVGIALSGTVVNAAAFCAFAWVARHDRLVAPMLSLNIWAAQWPAFSRTVRLGLPVAATYGCEAGFFSVLGLLTGSFGPAALAAHTVVNQAVYVVFMVAVGLSHAVSISISPAWARGDTQRARRLAWTGLGMGWLAMSAVAVVYLAAPQFVLGGFLPGVGSGDVATLAASLLGIAALLQFFDCSQNIAIGMLRGAGETRSAFVRTLIGYWLVGLPVAWWLGSHWQLGVVGLWLGLATGLAATAALLLFRFARVTAAALPGRVSERVAEA
jgi:MATE family multidrug resistance protein